MKKLLALLVVLAMSISVLASCNNGGTDTNDDNGGNDNTPKTPVITHKLTGEDQFNALINATSGGAAVKLMSEDWKAVITDTFTGVHEGQDGEENYSHSYRAAVTKDGNTYMRERETTDYTEGEEEKVWEVSGYTVVTKEDDGTYTYKEYEPYEEDKVAYDGKVGEAENLKALTREVLELDLEDDLTTGIFTYFKEFNITFKDLDFANDVYSLNEPKQVEMYGETVKIESAEFKLTITDGVVAVDFARFHASEDMGERTMLIDMGASFVYSGNTVTYVSESVMEMEYVGQSNEKEKMLYEKSKSEFVYTIDNLGRVVKVVEKHYNWEEKEEEEGEYEYVQGSGTYTTEIAYNAEGKVSKITKTSAYKDHSYKSEYEFTYGDQTIELPEIVEVEPEDGEPYNFGGNELPKQNA